MQLAVVGTLLRAFLFLLSRSLRWALLGLLFLIFSQYAHCDSESHASEPSTLIAYDGREVDLGRIALGAIPIHTFKIKNTTNKPFSVSGVKKSCGCQKANVEIGTVIGAGEIMSIAYSLPSSGGKKSGKLIITTTSEVESFKTIVLTLRVEVPREVWSTPKSIVFTPDSSHAIQEVIVESALPGLIEKFSGVETSRDYVKVELKERSEKVLRFSVSLNENISAEEVLDLITLRFSHPKKSQHTIVVYPYRQPFAENRASTSVIRSAPASLVRNRN